MNDEVQAPAKVPARIKVSRTRSRLYQLTPNQLALPNPLENSPENNSAELDELSDLHARMLRQRSRQRQRATHVLQYYAAVTSTVGVLPFPVVDMVAVSVMQLALIRELSRIYGVDFSKQRAKAAIAALLSGMQTGLVASSIFKYLPVVGYALTSMPVAFAVGGLTYAVGRVFMYHFELGGTLLDFDAEKLRGYFKSQLKR